jgi:LemA protein
MIWAFVAIIAVLAIFGMVLASFYNRLVRLRNTSENAWAQIDVQLKRRADLVPNLVESVKGYAAHERETFEAVTQARAQTQGARSVEERVQAENALTAALGRLIAVAEAYPQLRASENFQQLQQQLSETENKIAVSRQVFNDTVLTYNTVLETFPTNLLAGMLGFHPRTYFEADDAAREAPQVKF